MARIRIRVRAFCRIRAGYGSLRFFTKSINLFDFVNKLQKYREFSVVFGRVFLQITVSNNWNQIKTNISVFKNICISRDLIIIFWNWSDPFRPQLRKNIFNRIPAGSIQFSQIRATLITIKDFTPKYMHTAKTLADWLN